jgi:dipeptidyl aminopeptidase/acylaminoacyl peptidase
MRRVPPLGRERVAATPAWSRYAQSTTAPCLQPAIRLRGDKAVVALHGAGEGTRDGALYAHLHRVLPPAGIGVVTFDGRGEGESRGDASRGRFDVQAADALAALDAVDADRVGLWGYSQGGWVAPLAASRSDCVAIVIVPGAEHDLTLPDGTLAREYELALVDWLARV